MSSLNPCLKRTQTRQKGFTLTEVNLSVVLATLLLIPFIAFYGGTQKAFLNSYSTLNYLSKTKQLGDDIVETMRRVNALAFNTANMSFPAPMAAVADYTPAMDKHIQMAYTPYVAGVAQAAQTVHYVYNEALEQLWLEQGGRSQALCDPGMIKAFSIQYFDGNATVTPTLPNPTNVRRTRLTMIANPKAGMNIIKARNVAGTATLTRSMIATDTVTRTQKLKEGTTTAATAATLTPAGGLTAGYWNGGMLAIVSGKGKGQKVGITTNTAALFNVSPAFTNTPDATSRFKAYVSDFEGTAETVTTAPHPSLPAPAAAQTSVGVVTTPLAVGRLVDDQRAWTVNEWVGYYVVITAGTGSGQAAKIIANSEKVLYLMDIYRQDGWNDTSPTAIENSGATRFPTAPDATSRYMIIPRFYAVEEGTTSTVAGGTDHIIDTKKSNQWQQTLYPYKNRPAADRDTRVYSAFFQGYALEITSGPDAGKVRPPITNTNTRIDIRHTGGAYSAPVAANTGYRLVRLGKSADMGYITWPGVAQYVTPDYGMVSIDSTALNVITDSTKNWSPSAWIGGLLVFRVARDNNGGIIGYITANDATSVTFNTDAAPPPPVNPSKDDKYILDPPDSMAVAAGFTAKTIPLQRTAVDPTSGLADDYPENYWQDGYIAIFNPASVATTYQIRKIISREVADGLNVVRVSNAAGTVGEDFNPAPTAAYRYRIFHAPLKQIPFTWIGEAKLRKVTDTAGVF